MRVHLAISTCFEEDGGHTEFQVTALVFDESGLIGNAPIYEEVGWAQQPDEKMDLNLWATTILRGLAARMEETFVYVDQRPEATLIKHALGHQYP